MKVHWLLRGAIYSVVGLLGVLMAGFLLLWASLLPSRDAVLRVAAPSGDLVATVVEVNGGATTSFGYDVYVERDGWLPGSRKVATFYAATRSPNAAGVNVRWASSRELHVEYLSARSAQEVAPPFASLVPLVEVVLRPGITDPTAPPGGMLFLLSGSVVLTNGDPAVDALVGVAWLEDGLIGGPALAKSDAAGNFVISISFHTYSSSAGGSWYECNGKLEQVTVSASSGTHYAPPVPIPVPEGSTHIEAAPLELSFDVLTGVPTQVGG